METEHKPDLKLVCHLLSAGDLKDDLTSWQRPGMCPICGEHGRYFCVNLGDQVFKCHSCQSGGDSIKLVQLSQRLSFGDALDWIDARREKGVFYKGHAYRFD